MFKSLFGGNKEDKQVKAKLEQIEEYLTHKEFDNVIAEGEFLLEQQLSDKNKLSATRMVAIGYFHTKNYEKAIDYFQKIAESDKDNPDFLFNLSTSYILHREPEKGLSYLEDAISVYQTKGKKENMPVSYMIFYVIHALVDTEEYNLALGQIDRMAEGYKSMSITDSQFLYMRGYIPFHNFLEKVKDTLIGQDQIDSIEWLTEFAGHLDEHGQEQIEELIEDLKTEQQETTE